VTHPMQLQQPVGLFFLYGWRRGKGPYYLTNATTIDEGIGLAQPFLRTHRRVTVESVHEDGAVVWDSDRVLRATGRPMRAI
jgi:hypothetical protein